ncbi:acyl carrier protein [Paenibacillus sp. P26]|nr:acyl carrier protein [Paenibacillus sp. P26]
MKETITNKLSEALKVDIRDIDADESFADYGLDSIIGVHLVQVLNQSLSIELETTSLFDYSSVNRLAAYILSDHGEGAAQAWKTAVRGAAVSLSGAREPVSEPESMAAAGPLPDNGPGSKLGQPARMADIPLCPKSPSPLSE